MNVFTLVSSLHCHAMAKVLLLVSLASVAWCERPLAPLIPAMCGRHSPKAKMDTALVKVINDDTKVPLVVYLQSQQCYKCDLIPTVTVIENCTLSVDSRWPVRVEIRLVDSNGTLVKPSLSCSEESLTDLYVEGGVYNIYIQHEGSQAGQDISCMSVLMNDPEDSNIPIYVTISIGLFLIIMWILGKYLHRRGYIRRVLCFWSTENMMSDLGTPTNISRVDDSSGSEVKVPVKERLKSLDTFRGIAIIIMIFVNYGGGKYWFFKHSKWNGLTVADLVFPWFVFIMGTAMVFSFQGQLRRSVPKWKIFLKILKRSATLFILGLLINSFGMTDGVDFDNFRIPGVLQRFAGTYLITASVFLFLAPVHNPAQYTGWSAAFRDLSPYWAEWLVNLAFVVLHLIITFVMPVPGCPSGYLGPGGLENGGRFFNCTGGAAGYLDRKIFGPAHIYRHPTSTEIYKQSVGYDPEGLLGTLNSCFMCFLGLQAGKILFVHSDWVKRCRRFFLWSILTGGLSLVLCEASLNDGWIPINKNLWSLSFVLALSGMAFFLLMVCYLLIDVYKVWTGAPFYYAGMNSIALYCGHEFFSGKAPVSFVVPKTHASLLALNLWGATFWVLVSVYFYYKDIFISV
ncbi:heparan-alpha-glucosaminide N-acetyltransferase [Aplysia californica]|uniref:Heparan-alpha-glucosaminide N-acetyltransferase n=1 Tax=Aplysia californica TaxID=6500 RepID=A0ABM1A2E2_APLCA|nr:heparan-alpha-glucosaminide N-acetyltransferase [Aplysia californica]